MSSRRFKWLIVMMVISLTGITGVQIFWIDNAISIRNENFDNSVFNALHRTSEFLESSGNLSFVNEYLLRESEWFSDDTIAYRDEYFSFEAFSSIRSGGLPSRRSDYYRNYSRSRGGDTTINYHNPVITEVVPEGDSVRLVLGSSGNFGGTGDEVDDETESYSGRRVVIGQEEYIDWLTRRINELQIMSQQMISDLFEWERRLDLNPVVVGNSLERMLNLYGIKAPFEFAVIRGEEVAGGRYEEGNLPALLTSDYKTILFQGRLVKDEIVLALLFPDKRDYLIGSMSGILGVSLLFSLIILATFGLSLFFIVRQKKISEMKADFINNMTHEFKTPIATISLAADTITNPRVIADEKGVKHFVGMIKKENSRMNRQVETILQIASLDKHELEFRFSDLSLHSLIEVAVESMTIQTEQRNGTIAMKLNAADSVIYGDAEHLTNLIHNLLDNANKYSVDAPEITVETKNRDDGILLTVSDKGVGMSKAVQTRIFESFYRQSAGNIHNVKGFGLGLSYVKKIVDAHKGVIEVNSEPGKGSRFDIYLPFNWED